ncbi:MAG: hypothetical protein V4690_03415 [Patescibacteria group bacterium]
MMRESIIEKVVLALISLSFFIGIWHGFPFTNLVADEMFFSGSVLRSMEAGTFLPLPLDVPYGTLTFYLSYIFVGISLLVLFPFADFDLTALKSLIVNYPAIVYFASRLLSFVIAFASLYLFNLALKKYISDYRNRLVIVFILFGNILVNLLLHTSKVWILSTFLFLLSFYFLLQVFDTEESHVQKKYIWYSVILAFLAFSNFPFMGISLITIPIILYKKFRNKDVLKELLFSSLVGLVVFILITLTNFSGVKAQVYSIIYDYSFSAGAKIYNLTFFESLLSHLEKIFVMFPVLIFFAIYGSFKGRVKNFNLFWISLTYLIAFTFLIIFVDRWSIAPQSSLRYLFPVPFFIAFFVASFEYSFRKVLLIPVFVVFLYLVFSVYYISVPTTSHNLINFINKNFYSLDNVVLVNNVGVDVPISLNKKSAILFKSTECGSLCKATKDNDLKSDFKPLLLDFHTDPTKVPDLKNFDNYLILRSATTSKDLELTASFINDVGDASYYSLDSSGSYFDVSYFKLKNFGPNLYVYRQKTP